MEKHPILMIGLCWADQHACACSVSTVWDLNKKVRGGYLTLVDSLGGNAFWAAGASLFAPIPARPDWPLKLHAFANMGQLMQVHPRVPIGLQTFHELLQPSASMGAGLLFQQGPVRLELNFGIPLLIRAGDGSRKGLQFGIGLEFL